MIFLSSSQPDHTWTDWNCSPAMKLLIFPALTMLLLPALHWNSHFPVTYHHSPVHAEIPTGIPALLDKAGTNAVPQESSSFGLTAQSGLPNTQSCVVLPKKAPRCHCSLFQAFSHLHFPLKNDPQFSTTAPMSVNGVSMLWPHLWQIYRAHSWYPHQAIQPGVTKNHPADPFICRRALRRKVIKEGGEGSM